MSTGQAETNALISVDFLACLFYAHSNYDIYSLTEELRDMYNYGFSILRHGGTVRFKLRPRSCITECHNLIACSVGGWKEISIRRVVGQSWYGPDVRVPQDSEPPGITNGYINRWPQKIAQSAE